ncbi:MAG: type II toxin-antitoxin system RelE/ParE family toxin [Parachlamydiaceae bacterium]
MRYRIAKTAEFIEWFESQSMKARVQIEDRLSNIEVYGHFGTVNDVGDNVRELKWKNGRRIYYVFIPTTRILLLIGGNKNAQDYDIRQAKKILKHYTQ